ncbi:hypothetical protein [Aureimonas pseudogalii]|uniref:Uncharacterized protein n=1 Tax=Aureimonas pseudogalii TaxID=1744844 RepID=A0A7W6H7S1_9HYPH|nr:hypothetical protein [Aureimonas pseudogalii]MBB4000126.1 hypothetical protein [Aureimonas pseudogalii]
MTLNDYEKLRDTVAFASRFISTSLMFTHHPVARDYHTRAIEQLQTITNTISTVVKAQRAFDEAKNDAAREAISDDLMEATLAFDMAAFNDAPVHLGDHLVIDNATDEFRIAPFGRWLPLNDNMPITTRIPLPELDRLYDVLENLYEETGINITAQEIRFVPVGRDD